MGQLQQVVQIVDRRAYCDVPELLLRGLQMLLDLLELLKAVAGILVELALHFIADRQQLLIDLLADRVQALARLGGERLDLQLQGAPLLFAPVGRWAPIKSRNALNSWAIAEFLAEIALGLLHAVPCSGPWRP